MSSQESINTHRILPVWIAQLAIGIIGGFIVLTTSLQGSIITLQSKPTLDQRVASIISIISIVLHFLITLLAYLSDPPMLNSDTFKTTKKSTHVEQLDTEKAEPIPNGKLERRPYIA